MAATAETPKYGGTLTLREAVEPTNGDSAASRQMLGGLTQWYVFEQLLDPDWLKGPAGTGEYDFRNWSSPDAMMGPTLAESVVKPSPDVWILKIRQGMHYQPVDSEAGRLMGGREVTTDDIVWNYERMIHGPDTAISVLQPRVAAAMKVEKTGPWEITMTTPVQPITAQWWVIEGGGYAVLHPRQVVEKYGNVSNWRNAVGTGPFMLIDYVPGSQVLYKRNPNYWGKDPLGTGKGNQLPYIDTLRRLIIPDTSTFLAAVRTGKIDMTPGLSIDDTEQLSKTAPRIQHDEYLPTGFGTNGINFNLADPKKPWADLRVRQALMYATDFNAFVNGYYKGKAELDMVLVDPNFTGKGYKPLSTMSESVQSLFKYNPEKAKQLLKDAGYPTGFKADMLVPTAAALVDQMAIIKDMWSKVGVDLNIVQKETAVLTGIVTRTFDWTDMFYGAAGGSVGSFGFSVYTYVGYYRGDNRLQFASRTDPNGKPDPFIEGKFAEMEKNIYVNWPAAYKAIEELRPYLIENAFKIPLPQPYLSTFWWPWMKNTYGQGPNVELLKYYWIDQDLKKSMGF